MASKTEFEGLAGQVVKGLGDPENIRTFTHCATRLRFKVKDDSKVNTTELEKIDGVLAVVAAGGQQQVVIGNDVPLAYAAVKDVAGMEAKATKDSDSDVTNDNSQVGGDDGQKKNFLNRFIDLISALFTPIVMVMAGVAIGSAFLSMANQFNWLREDSGTSQLFSAAFDGVFYFLPIMLAITAAKRFRMNTFVALAVVMPLLHPDIVTLAGKDGVTAFGLPFPSMTYSSSVIPAIVAVWAASYVEHWCNRHLPGAVRNFFTPLIVVTVMVPLTLFTIGPATTWISQLVADGLTSVNTAVPWLAGAILGGLWQVLVLFGLHWGLIPVFINNLAVNGSEPMLSPILVAVLAQASATAAVAIWSRSASRKKVAIPAAFSGIVAGVTEPAIYGVNLPLKLPFYMGIGGGAIGGVIASLAGAAANSFVFPSFLAFPAYLEQGNLWVLFTGVAVGMIIAFVGTAVTLRRAEAKLDVAVDDSGAADSAPAARSLTTPDTTSDSTQVAVEKSAGAAATASATATVPAAVAVAGAASAGAPVVTAPIAGSVVALGDVADKVFASGAMGKGIAIEPDEGNVYAPVSGTIIAVQATGHAYGIRSDDGVDVLIHVGIDTVLMKGEGFTVNVAAKQHVDAGELLGTVDLLKVAEHGHPATTMVVVTNTRKLVGVTPTEQDTVTAGDPILFIEK